jgi:hypothetical protein
MKKITGSDIIILLKSFVKNSQISDELKELKQEDFDTDDLLIKLFFNVYPGGFTKSAFFNTDKDTLMDFANVMSNVKKEISLYGLRKAHNLLQNIRNADNKAVEMENTINELTADNNIDTQIKTAQLIDFLSKYIDGHENKIRLANAVKNINAYKLKEASEQIQEVFSGFYPEKNVKLAFTTLKNQVGESYQLCAKGIYIWGQPVPMALSNCREYCIDVRKNPDGTIGCNYLKWLNENLTTQQQALNIFDKMPVEQDTMNLEKDQRTKFPMSDQDPLDSHMKRLDKSNYDSWEVQLEEEHAKSKGTKPTTTKRIFSDKALDALLKDTRDAFDEEDLDVLENQIRASVGE